MRPQAMRAIVLVCAIAVTFCTISVLAQSPTGSIEGVIVDQSHAPLAGVTVTLRHEATGIERSLQTDSRGLFRAPLLPVGVYELGAALDGFRPIRRADIELTVGETLGLRLEMAIADIVETITVSSAGPILEPGRSKASSIVDDFAIHHLPVNGRNFVDFALLTPGVTRDSNGDLSFAGQRSMFNSLIVDGADNNNTFFGQSLGRVGSGRAPYQFSEDAVQEFQVNSNAYSAEYGRAAGAVINVVTKSGTNQLSGSVFEFYRDKALNATNVINLQNGQPKSPYHYHQFGGTTGGPLRTNRDFFFLNVEAQRNTSPNVTFLNLPTNLPGDPLTAAGIAMLQPLASSWTRRLDQNVFLVRTDHHVGDSNLTVRYNHQDFAGEGYESGGPQVALEHSGASRVQTRTLNGSWAGTLRGNLLNELRIQYARDDEPGGANSSNPEAVVQQGAIVFVIGRNNFSPRFTNLDRMQAADTLTWTRGRHQVKLGADVQSDSIKSYFPQYFSGSYTFKSLASFALGRPNQPGEFYQQTFPGAGTSGPYTSLDDSEFSAFAQDSWRPHPDVTLNLGLRYDLMAISAPVGTNPDPQLLAANIDTGRVNPDANNVGPRLGLAWNPGGGSYVLRGGWGIFYGRTPALRISSSANNGINVVALTFTGNDVPTYPQTFSSIPATGSAARPNVFYVDQRFSSPRIMQANSAIEWQWRGTTLTATYLFVEGEGLPRSVDRNIGTEGTRTFTIAGTGQTVPYLFFGPDRPFSNFNRVIALESNAESRYNGLTLELNRRFTRGLQFRAAYTLGRVVDTLPDASIDDAAAFPSNPINFEVDRTVGNGDQRQRLVTSGVFTPPGTQLGSGVARALTRDWSFSAIVTAESGKPYTARVVGIDLNNDGNPRNDRAPGTERNAFRLPAIVTVDARIAREIPLQGRVHTQLLCEAFNLVNRANINGVVTSYYSLSGTTLTRTTNFGRPNASAGERILQLAVRVTF